MRKSGKLATFFATKLIEEVERIIDDELQVCFNFNKKYKGKKKIKI